MSDSRLCPSLLHIDTWDRDALPHSGDINAKAQTIIDTILTAIDRDPPPMRFLVLCQHDGTPSPDHPVAVVSVCVQVAVVTALAPVLMGVVLQPQTNALYGRLPMSVAPLAHPCHNRAARTWLRRRGL